MTKVLVTGASGFIGYHLAAALASRGDDVTCFVRETSRVDRLQALGVRMVFGDVTDPDTLPSAVAGQHIVFHLAGRVTVLRQQHFYAVNHLGTANVAKACAGPTTPPLLVYISSLAAAGAAIDGRPRVESDAPRPVSHYGRSKREGELALERLAHRLPATIVRPPIVLGEGDRTGLPLFRSVIRFGVHLSPSFRPRRFSVIHAADLVQLILRAAQHGRRLPPIGHNGDPAGPGNSAGQGYYFAACEQDPTYPDLGRLVAQSVGRSVVVIPAVRPLVYTVAAASELISRVAGQPMPVNFDKAREIAAGSWLCSAQAAKNDLGFEIGVPLVQRLRQTVEWYQREGWL